MFETDIRSYARQITMVIKGTVYNGQIQINKSLLPDGTDVLITPVHTTSSKAVAAEHLTHLKAEVERIATLPSENNDNDGFSGADHDRIIYGA